MRTRGIGALTTALGFQQVLTAPLSRAKVAKDHALNVIDGRARAPGPEAIIARDASKAAAFLEAATTWCDRARQLDRGAEMLTLHARQREPHGHAFSLRQAASSPQKMWRSPRQGRQPYVDAALQPDVQNLFPFFYGLDYCLA